MAEPMPKAIENISDYDSDVTIIYDYEHETSKPTNFIVIGIDPLIAETNGESIEIDLNHRSKLQKTNSNKRLRSSNSVSKKKVNEQQEKKRQIKPKIKPSKSENKQKTKLIKIAKNEDDSINIFESKTPLPKQSQLKLWADTHKPQFCSEFIGNSDQVVIFKEWLTTWKEKFDNTNGLNDESDDEDSVNLNSINGKCLYIYGPNGVGKTSLVYSMANDCDYKVLEYNATSQRLTPNLIQKDMNESLQSYYIHQNSIANIFQGAVANKKQLNKKKSPNRPRLSKSLILIDDIDGICYENRSFIELWRSLRQTIIDARKPIVITSRYDSSFLCNENSFFNEIHLKTIGCIDLFNHIQHIIQTKHLSNVNINELKPIFQLGDVRRLINEAQFWIKDNGEEKSLAKTNNDIQENQFDMYKTFIDFQSMNDIYHVALDSISKQCMEDEHHYNRYVEQEVRLNCFQDDIFQIFQRIFNYDQTIDENEDKQIYHLIDNYFMPKISNKRSSTFSDYYDFFNSVNLIQPNFIEQVLKIKQRKIIFARSSRSESRHKLLFM